MTGMENSQPHSWSVPGWKCRTIVAQWTTRDFGAPAVRWGVQSGVVQYQNNGSYSTYTKLQMCGPPANTKGGIPHRRICFSDSQHEVMRELQSLLSPRQVLTTEANCPPPSCAKNRVPHCWHPREPNCKSCEPLLSVLAYKVCATMQGGWILEP